MKRVFLYLLAVAVALAACSRVERESARPEKSGAASSDTLYTERAAMMTYATDPERALMIIDSAQVVGNVDAFQADLLRAIVYGRSFEEPQQERALEICRQLLENREACEGTKESDDKRLNILGVMNDVYRNKQDYENWLEYAIEIVEINRKWGYETDAIRTEAEIGVVFTSLGRKEEGLEKLNHCIEALASGAPSIDRMDAWIVANWRKISVLQQDEDYKGVIALAQAVIAKIEDYERHPSDYAEDSYRLPYDPIDRAHYCSFCRAKSYAHLAQSYAALGQRREARAYTLLFESSDFGHSYSGRKAILPAWIALGDWDKVLAVNDEIEKHIGADTLSAEYAAVLHNRSEAASARGRYREAYAWLSRYASIQDQLAKHLQESHAQEYAAWFHQKEQELALTEARAEYEIMSNHLVGLLLLFVLAILALVFFARERRLMVEKNRALVRMINEQPRKADTERLAEVAPAAHAELSPESMELFHTIDRTIREERLYANASLQRQDILDRWNLRRQALNDLMSAFADGESFPSYINGIRLEEAVSLLRNEPDLTLANVAEEVGMNLANFRIQFKQRYGMTPAEYRENL